MLISTTEKIGGKKITKNLGLVMGSTVRVRWFGRDIAAGLKSIVGGEVKSYTDMIAKARQEAIDRMVNEAQKLKADAVVEVRFTTSDIMQGASEVLAYGTAVKLG